MTNQGARGKLKRESIDEPMTNQGRAESKEVNAANGGTLRLHSWMVGDALANQDGQYCQRFTWCAQGHKATSVKVIPPSLLVISSGS